MSINLNNFYIGKKEVLPLVEGGKGIGASDGRSAGAWALQGGIGTFSGVNAKFSDDNRIYEYQGKDRFNRHQELITNAVSGAIYQASIARDIAGSKAFINMNILWEMGAAQIILEEVLKNTGDLIDGITCGAGLPYRLAEIASTYGKYYFPIISSARAFYVLWKRAYHKYTEFIGGVVYEDPWLAGGHNGLSNQENPIDPQLPYQRVVTLRAQMNECGLEDVPIIMAGGVWWLNEWQDWINNNDEIGKIGFQFGSRPLLTQESPISSLWKQELLNIKRGDVYLNKFSPTGFYSSAVHNAFLDNLIQRSKRQLSFQRNPDEVYCYKLPLRNTYIMNEDAQKAIQWIEEGFSECMKTPEDTVVFVTPLEKEQIVRDQGNCMGCLSACAFSNWSDHTENYSTNKLPDPRSFCIQKTLQYIANGYDPTSQLMFAGKNSFRFGEDPFYENGFIPSVKELIDRILTGF